MSAGHSAGTTPGGANDAGAGVSERAGNTKPRPSPRCCYTGDPAGPGRPCRTSADTPGLQAVSSAGNRSANSNSVSFATPADTTPPSPAPVISASQLTPTGVVLTWSQPVDDFSQVYWTLFVDGSVFGYADRLGPPTQTLLGLTPETSYTFQVSLRDASGNSATGPPLVVTTPAANDGQAPTAPTNLRVSSPDGLDLRLFWNGSTDNADPPSAIRYEVFLDGVRRATILGTNAWMSCESADPVEIFVQAVDTSGNVSPPSNTVLFEDCNP